jgi:hypothetical protein
MKRILFISAIAIGFVSCNKIQKSNEQTEPILDCDCDRVVEVSNFSLPQMDGLYYYVLTTINDCSGIQRQESGNVLIQNAYELGDCYK